MQNKFINLLPEWFKSIHSLLVNNVDKIAHFSVMYMIADIMIRFDLSFTFVAVTTFIIALVKEVFDKIVTLKWSLLDFIATFLGGILAIIINNLQ